MSICGDDERDTIVIDNGSGSCKIGIAGDDVARAVFPAMIGRAKYQMVMPNLGNKDTFIGEEAQQRADILSLTYPMEHGVINNWDDMEKLWHHGIVNHLRVDPEQHWLLLSDVCLNPFTQREKMAEIMFEKFHLPMFYVAQQTVLSMYSAGFTSALMVSCGDGVTEIVPFYHGCIIANAVKRLNMGGRDLSSYLQRRLCEKGHHFQSSAGQDIVRKIKERLCYVSKNGNASASSCRASFKLPDDTDVTLDEERYQCPEALFQPSLLGHDSAGIHSLVHESVSLCPIDTRKELYSYVIATGGSTLFEGFADRMKAELQQLVAGKTRVNIRLHPEKEQATWVGGSILGSLRCFKGMWVTQNEYNEFGPNIVHRKCFS